MITEISSTDEFVKEVFEKRGVPDDTVEIYYRGHSESGYDLIPTVFRDSGHKASEDQLFGELQVLHPGDFANDLTTLEKLVRMQHHSLPTRLLDITSNPLMALYFACHSGGKPDRNTKSGEVFILKVSRSAIKFYDSDTASCLANLARLTNEQRDDLIEANSLLSKPDDVDEFNEGTGRLLHFIKDEKPYFLPIIRPMDIFSVLCVKTKFSNLRIMNQVGAMLLFGIVDALTKAGTATILVDAILIPAKAKTRILDELDILNIKHSTVFPYIENTALHLATKYKNRVAS